MVVAPSVISLYNAAIVYFLSFFLSFIFRSSVPSSVCYICL